jgi:hypothetical protein
MLRLIPLTALVVLAVLLAPGQGLGHNGGEPLIHVPLDHVMPGERFPVIGADLGPRSQVSFAIRNGGHVLRLGRITVGSDGHLATTFALPPRFPNGYARLTASGSNGSRAATWILVGTRAESTPAAKRGTDWWRYAAPILLVLGLGGTATALAARRSARRRS